MFKFAKFPQIFGVPNTDRAEDQLAEVEPLNGIQMNPHFDIVNAVTPERPEPGDHGEPATMPDTSMGDGHAKPHFQPNVSMRGNGENDQSPQVPNPQENQVESVDQETGEYDPGIEFEIPEQALNCDETDEQDLAETAAFALDDKYIDPDLPAETSGANSLKTEISDSAEFAPTTGEEFLGMFAVVVPDLPPEPEEDEELPEFMDCFF